MASRAQTLPTPSDEELARRFAETGDETCFKELFERHGKKVFFACRRFFSDSDAAEDATQETFLRVYQRIRQFQEGNFLKWLMRIARNICIDEWRKRRPEAQNAAAEISEVPEMARCASSEIHLAVGRLREEMKKLSFEQRRCIEMKIEGYSYEETAARTGLSVEAVKSHLQNGRRMLWLKMGEELSQLS